MEILSESETVKAFEIGFYQWISGWIEQGPKEIWNSPGPRTGDSWVGLRMRFYLAGDSRGDCLQTYTSELLARGSPRALSTDLSPVHPPRIRPKEW